VNHSVSDQFVAQVAGLRVEFQTKDGPVIGVEDMSFDVKSGETACIVGESGSGKSVSSLSLMRLVEFGVGQIARGQILFDRRNQTQCDITQATSSVMMDVRGNEIGMIFQEPMTALNPVFTIGRQLTEGLRWHKGLSAREAETQALELLGQVRIPEPERRIKQFPHELSGGMRQRVVIAMALACKPRLLIADEPTTALDVTIQAEILALIDRLKKETGTAVIFITHDMAVVAQMADRVVVMFRGNKVEEGPFSQIFERPKHDYTKSLLSAVQKLGEMTGQMYPEPMRSLGVSEQKIEPIQGTDRPLLRVNGLTTRFAVEGGFFRRVVARVHAVEDVSFDINEGQTLSLVGESGCGKSTVGRSILRLIEPTSGQVELAGIDVMKLSGSELRKMRQEMQMIFQDPFASLNPQMPLIDQVAEPLTNYNIARGSEVQDRVASLFDRVHLPRSFMRRYPHEMSGGQRQRVAIARALVSKPRLILADEPTGNLDRDTADEVFALMSSLTRETGAAYVVATHDPSLSRDATRVVRLDHGRIIDE